MKKRLLKQIVSSISNNFDTKKILNNPALLPINGEIKDAIVLTSSLSNSSKIIDKFQKIDKEKGTQNYFKILNTYLDNFTKLILIQKQSSNFIESIDGDQISSVFSNIYDQIKNFSLENNAFNSLSTALNLKKLESNINKKYSKVFTDYKIIDKDGNEKIIKVPKFDTVIGIDCGKVIMGLVNAKSGSFNRTQFQIIGEPSDNSKIVKNLNKIYKTKILCTGNIYNLIEQTENKGQISFRVLDKVRFFENGSAIQLYDVCGFSKEISREKNEEIEIFNTAIEKYNKKDFANAGKLFLQANSISGNDATSLVFAQRCKKLIQNGINKDWDGIINLDLSKLF